MPAFVWVKYVAIASVFLRYDDDAIIQNGSVSVPNGVIIVHVPFFLAYVLASEGASVKNVDDA